MAKEGDHSTDAAIGWLIIACVIGAMLYALWWIFETEIKNAIRWFRYAQIWIIEKVLAFWKFLNSIIGRDPGNTIIPHKGQELEFEAYYPLIPNVPASQIDADVLMVTSAMAMEPMKYIFTAIIGWMAYWALTKGPKTHFRRKLGLDGLIRVQSKIFPVVAPVVDFNPSKMPFRAPGSPVPAELPIFSEALDPEEWVAYNEIPMPDGKMDESAMWKAFAKQLGPPWRGYKKMQPYRQVILAAFCLKAARKRSESDDILGRVAMCWDHKSGLQLNRDRSLLKDCRKILADEGISGKTLQFCNQHAWENTAMLRALQHAREQGGVLAPATFIWLRAFDRRLWYPLNNLGRHAYHMEALGAMAHYRIEKTVERPVPKPYLDDCIKTTRQYIENEKSRPIPALDYGEGNKRAIKKPV